MNDSTRTRSIPRTAGLLLASGALGFVAVFAWLADAFGYPDVLDLPASEVLPALLAGGPALRAVWAIYAILPLSIVSAAWMARGRLGLRRDHDRWATAAGVLAGLAMTLGLARWSTLQWWLAERWAESGADHAALAARFDSLNLVLGNAIGEALGEIALGAWLIGVAWPRRDGWLGRCTLLLAVEHL